MLLNKSMYKYLDIIFRIHLKMLQTVLGPNKNTRNKKIKKLEEKDNIIHSARIKKRLKMRKK